MRQKKTDLHEAGIQVQRLAELPDRFPLQLFGAPGAVGDAEEHVGVSRARIEARICFSSVTFSFRRSVRE